MDAEQIMQEAKAYEEQIIKTRRHLHKNPETGFDIKNTFEFVKNELEKMGLEPAECGKAGLTVTVGKDTGKVFMLRADMDALPIKEESGVEFASDNGNMHACGHDMHTAMLLGAAKILKQHENELKGMVKLDFQPAEEIFEGSDDMIKAGLLENPKVDASLMIHVSAAMPMPSGTVIVCDGGVSAPAADYFTIKVQGKGCHGSMPDKGIDPISIAAHIITSLHEIHARELNLLDEAVLTIGSIHGGNAGNVIPDTVEMSGTIRTYNEETRSYLKQRIQEISESTAKTFRGEAYVTFGSGCPTLVNDTGLSKDISSYTKELLGERGAFSAGQLMAMSGGKPSKQGGSEDFAYISHKVPSIMLALAAGEPANGYIYPQHHPKVKFDEQILYKGSAVYAYNAMRWLEEH